MNKRASTPSLEQTFLRQTRKLWPALKGSLARVYKPCIRKNCPACARGDKHPAWILSFLIKGQRRCMYVPPPLVKTLRQALRNGRKLEELLSKTGPELIKYHRQQRDAFKKSPKPHPKS
jgi:hypothetical protein